MADVFISYSRKDKDFVRGLHQALEERDRDVWVDWEDIPLTAKWLEEIYSGIESAGAFAFVISPDSVVSKVCKQELDHAVEHNKRLVPIMRRDVDAGGVPQVLAAHNWIFFREDDDFGEALRLLLKALDTDPEWVRAHTGLLTRAKEWESEGRDSSFLLRGKGLEVAEAWQVREAEKEPKLTPLQKEYILASRQAVSPPPFLVPAGLEREKLVGGDDLLLELKEDLLDEDSSSRRVVLELLPGVGKSEQAIQLANDGDVRKHFSGGVLWASLGQTPDVNETLTEWAEELGVALEKRYERDGIEGKKKAIQKAIGESRVLMVIDDAWRAGDVDDLRFFRNHNCAYLVTTRLPEVAAELAEEEFIKDVPVLNEAESKELLKKKARTAVEQAEKEDPGAVEELVEATGGLPLALVLMGNYLRIQCRPYTPDRLRQALDQMRQAEERLRLTLTREQTETRRGLPQDEEAPSLLTVIRLSYEALGNESRRTLRNLSIFRLKKLNGFTKEAALEVAGASEETLGVLLARELLEPINMEMESDISERYVLQRTIADFARSLLAEEEAEELHRKAARYYHGLLSEYEDRRDITSYRRWYRYEDPEWQTIKADWLYHLAHTRDRSTARLDFARVYFDAFWWWGYYLDFPFCDQLLSEWGRTKTLSEDDREWLRLLREFHDSYLTGYERLLREWEQTQPLSNDDEEWLRLLREFHESPPIEYEEKREGDWTRVEQTLLGLCRLGDLEGQASELDDDRRHLRAVIDTFLAHARRYRRSEDSGADGYYEESLSLFKQAEDDAWNIPWILYELGDLLMERGQSDEALRRCQESLRLAAEEGEEDREVIALDYRVRADVFWQRGDLDQAFDNYAYAGFYAYAFHGSEKPDLYTVALHREMVERMLVRLRTLWNEGQRNKTLRVSARLHGFWEPYWKEVGEPEVDPNLESLWEENRLKDVAAYLFPAEPEEEDLKNPRKYVKQVNNVFEEMIDQIRAT